MPRHKSMIIRSQVDKAKRAHKCKNNVRHRIERGDKRLKVLSGRNQSHYCERCANIMLKRGHEALEALARDLQ